MGERRAKTRKLPCASLARDESLANHLLASRAAWVTTTPTVCCRSLFWRQGRRFFMPYRIYQPTRIRYRPHQIDTYYYDDLCIFSTIIPSGVRRSTWPTKLTRAHVHLETHTFIANSPRPSVLHSPEKGDFTSSTALRTSPYRHSATLPRMCHCL